MDKHRGCALRCARLSSTASERSPPFSGIPRLLALTRARRHRFWFMTWHTRIVRHSLANISLILRRLRGLARSSVLRAGLPASAFCSPPHLPCYLLDLWFILFTRAPLWLYPLGAFFCACAVLRQRRHFRATNATPQCTAPRFARRNALRIAPGTPTTPQRRISFGYKHRYSTCYALVCAIRFGLLLHCTFNARSCCSSRVRLGSVHAPRLASFLLSSIGRCVSLHVAMRPSTRTLVLLLRLPLRENALRSTLDCAFCTTTAYTGSATATCRLRRAAFAPQVRFGFAHAFSLVCGFVCNSDMAPHVGSLAAA